MNEAALKIIGISKKFPGVQALKDINIDAYSGEALGLVGVNGAGKSTLMNILDGVIRGDAGEIYINNIKVIISSPKVAEENGIAFIHQEAVLFSTMTIAENMFISKLPTSKLSIIDLKKIKTESAKYLEMLGSNLDPMTKISSLSIGDRQLVEIARALAKGSQIILFDEPTSSLTFKEKERLYDIIRSLKQQGRVIIFISHFLDEVFEICDRIAVLRDGTVSGKGMLGEFSKEDVVKLMLGRDIVQYIPQSERQIKDVLLRVSNLTRGKAPRNITFELKRGEILGLWGLLGSGRTELIRALLDFDRAETGEIYLNEKAIERRITGSELQRISGYVTENRHEDGLFLPSPLWENVTVASSHRFTSKIFKLLDMKNERQCSRDMIKTLNIAAPDEYVKVQQLSGGNQQKVVMGKWLLKQPLIYFLDEPTRGVDVGAKAEIHKIIASIAEKGYSVILISSEIEEILNLSDRILVLNKGSIVGEVQRCEMNKDYLMSLCVGEGNR